MPKSPKRPCTFPGCQALAIKQSRCSAHQQIDTHTGRKKNGWESARKSGNRHKRGYNARWERLRKLVLVRDNYLCQAHLKNGEYVSVVVGNPFHPRAANVDHIINKALGGTDDPSNLQTLCKTCHDAKTIAERYSAPADESSEAF